MPSKLIAAYADPTAPARIVTDPALRDRLAAAGVSRVQVNLDDAEVADAALRLTTGEPIVGVVMVWHEGLDGDLLAALPEPGLVGAWGVTERRPIEPPPVADGVRHDTLANLAFLRLPKGMRREEWLDYWLGTHTQIAIDTQATFGYVQNIVEEALLDLPLPVAAVVEELFPMAALADAHAFYGSGGDPAELTRRLGTMLQSVAKFGADRDLELVPTSRFTFDC